MCQGMDYVHRLIFTWYVGEIPQGMHVLHKCDNPSCVNPYHLFLGTHQDNMRDRDAKGRGNVPNGEQHGRSKLTKQAVLKIRKLYAEGVRQVDLAKMFNVGQPHISDVVRRVVWTHV